MKTSHMVNESTRNTQRDAHAEKRVWHLSQLRLARVGTHLSCTFWLREVHGGWGYSIVRQFAVPALSTRTNSFLLSPQQINTVLTSTQPVSQTSSSSSRQAGRQAAGAGRCMRSAPSKRWESETPRGLSHVELLLPYSVGNERWPTLPSLQLFEHKYSSPQLYCLQPGAQPGRLRPCGWGGETWKWGAWKKRSYGNKYL